jgi:putative intracellular protease/amidase
MKRDAILRSVFISSIIALAALLVARPSSSVVARSPDRAAAKVYVCPPCGQDCDKLTFDKPGVCPHCGMTLVEKSQQLTVAILVFDRVQIIDYSGPWEVFGQAGFIVHTVSEKLDPIRTAFGQRVIPDFTLETCPKSDILLIPGGGVDDQLSNPSVIQWIQSRSKDAQYVMSVCTGAFLLAKAGLLDGASATTFHRAIDSLTRDAPKTRVVYDQRFVDNGKVITTAGLSSGIDGALHLVGKVMGNGAAQAIALGMEYQWDPDSNYARAALADRHLPRLRDMGGKVQRTQGTRDRWEIQWLVPEAGSPTKIADAIGKRIAGSPSSSSMLTLAPAAAPNSGNGATLHWEFKDDRGRHWHGDLVAEPSAENKDVTLVTMNVKCQ